jgi:hypothetical protein
MTPQDFSKKLSELRGRQLNLQNNELELRKVEAEIEQLIKERMDGKYDGDKIVVEPTNKPINVAKKVSERLAAMNESKNIAEHDIVVASCTLPKVPRGSVGTVVRVYEGKSAFEVEFIVKGSSIVETVSINQIEIKK